MPENPQQSAALYGYEYEQTDTRRSASIIVPLLMETFRPSSVVDFGCGLGDWLKAFEDLGTEEILGFEGDWIPTERVRLPSNKLRRFDLGRSFAVDQRFDLAMSLEVAEHVNDESGDRLITALATSSDLVFFSAAIPDQGGGAHINEQYQSHWARKFAERGFAAFDFIRPKVWGDDRVCWWYQQNCFIYANEKAIKRFRLIDVPIMMDVIHPALYDRAKNPNNWGGRAMVAALYRKFSQRLGR